MAFNPSIKKDPFAFASFRYFHMAFLLNGNHHDVCSAAGMRKLPVVQWRPLLAMSSFVANQFSRLSVVSVIFS